MKKNAKRSVLYNVSRMPDPSGNPEPRRPNGRGARVRGEAGLQAFCTVGAKRPEGTPIGDAQRASIKMKKNAKRSVLYNVSRMPDPSGNPEPRRHPI